MCLGIPAQVQRDGDHADLVVALVSGAERSINVGLLDQRPAQGDWIMVHMGFALEPMTEQEAQDALAVLAMDQTRLDQMLAERPDGSTLRPG